MGLTSGHASAPCDLWSSEGAGGQSRDSRDLWEAMSQLQVFFLVNGLFNLQGLARLMIGSRVADHT